MTSPNTPPSQAERRARAVARGKALARQAVIANVAAIGVFLVVGALPLVYLLASSSDTRAGNTRSFGRMAGLAALPGIFVALYVRRRLLERDPLLEK